MPPATLGLYTTGSARVAAGQADMLAGWPLEPSPRTPT
jgi:hypothetical protein